ncbi:MAG: Hsp20/alpha crystallin family protein [Spirochaetaceae bacterium]|jgi:HSP20 family molecular chaperone IbpA|nr:Hsp20/alpha crystallin family protein [Spirochaetaceae bacterium]
MMNKSGYYDMSSIFDEIFEAAQDFGEELKRNLNNYGMDGKPFTNGNCPPNPFAGAWTANVTHAFDEHTDYYPNYSYPPMNVYMATDMSMVFEFALAGFEEKDLSLSFQGDYMVISAKLPKKEAGETASGDDSNNKYFKRRLKLKDIEKEKFYVPMDKYAQEKVKAVYKNGILKVTVPPKDEPDLNDGVKIEIVAEE